MPEIKALLGGSACDLGGGLRAEWEPGAIQVTFPNGRGQKVRYQRRGEYYLFTSRVATEGHLRHLRWKEISREILLRNRLTQVVAFGVRNWYAVTGRVGRTAGVHFEDGEVEVLCGPPRAGGGPVRVSVDGEGYSLEH